MSKNRKKIMVFAGGAVLLVAIVCSVLFFRNREEEYRTIQVYKFEGSATVDRGDAGSIDAYEGMMIQSGDTVCTDEDSYLYFKMDEDKYALLEPGSIVHIEASGTDSDSRTVFNLETGALVSRIDNKLNSNSVYEVNTPNSTMAVRGTIFRIEVTYDESGDSYTNVYVFDGTVECQLVFKDGSVDEETRQAEKGMMIRIRGDDTISEYIADDGTVDYEQLPAEVLRFLLLAIEDGIELPVSKEELETILSDSSFTEKGEQEQKDETAAAISTDVNSSDDSSQANEEKEDVNHTGGTEQEDSKNGDGTKKDDSKNGNEIEKDVSNRADGIIKDDAKPVDEIEKDDSENGDEIIEDACNHAGGTEIRDSVAATCSSEGYTGDTYCLKCGEKLQEGSVISKAASNHTGGTEIRNRVAEDCCTEGYTGDTYCLGCGTILEKGKVIAATGNHPAAACGINGHHAHDGKNHDIASCNFLDHHNCDGRTHGKNCFETDAAYFNIEVIVADNGKDWSFTINNTVYKKNAANEDGNQYYYYFQGNAGNKVTISRTGTTGDFYAVSEGMTRIDGTNSISFTLKEGEEQYVISVYIS